MALDVEVVAKIRGKNNVITGYRLFDLAGGRRDVTAVALKQAIKSGQVNVKNLKLTSDGRLIDKKDTTQKQQIVTDTAEQLEDAIEKLMRSALNEFKKQIKIDAGICVNEVRIGNKGILDGAFVNLFPEYYQIKDKTGIHIGFGMTMWEETERNNYMCTICLDENFDNFEHNPHRDSKDIKAVFDSLNSSFQTFSVLGPKLFKNGKVTDVTAQGLRKLVSEAVSNFNKMLKSGQIKITRDTSEE